MGKFTDLMNYLVVFLLSA